LRGRGRESVSKYRFKQFSQQFSMTTGPHIGEKVGHTFFVSSDKKNGIGRSVVVLIPNLIERN